MVVKVTDRVDIGSGRQNDRLYIGYRMRVMIGC